MRIRSRLVALLSGIILTMTMAPAASAVTFKDCVNIDDSYNPTWHVLRNTATYYAAQGEVVIRQLRGCTNSNESVLQDYAAQAWPANMQGTNELKQIGYANETSNGMSMNWFATKYSGFSENVSPMSLLFYPVVGHTVRFSIYRYAPGGLVYWRLKVDDLSHAGWYGWRDLVQIAPSVSETWYGIEDHSKQSQFGSNSAASPVQLRGLSYRLSNGGAWNYLTGNTGVSQGYWANAGLGVPSCWAWWVSTYAGPYASDQTSVNGYTNNNC